MIVYNKISKEEMVLVNSKALEIYARNVNYTLGDAWVNALHQLHPNTANEIINTSYNPKGTRHRLIDTINLITK